MFDSIGRWTNLNLRNWNKYAEVGVDDDLSYPSTFNLADKFIGLIMFVRLNLAYK